MRVVLLFAAIAATGSCACTVCGMGAIPGTYTQECLGVSSVFSCNAGQVNYSKTGTPGDSIAFDKATCIDEFPNDGIDNGTWFGTTCTGSVVYLIADDNPWFACNGIVPPTTTTTVTPSTTTVTTTTPVPSSTTTTTPSTTEPPLCPQLLSRGGLEYLEMTADGLQRYACPGYEFGRTTLDQGRTVRARYFECNSTYYRLGSSNNDFWALQDPIVDFSCRDYGPISLACSVPFLVNAWNQNGVVRCVKGYFPVEIRYVNAANTISSYVAFNGLSTATCGAGGWSFDGLSQTNARMTGYSCLPVPSSTGKCAALAIAPNSLQFDPRNDFYECWPAEQMTVITPAPAQTYTGLTLQCVSGDWQFSGPSSTVTIPGGSNVSCSPIGMAVLPPTSAPLIYLGQTPQGLSRWTCFDASVTLDIEQSPVSKTPVHAPYLDCNNTYYQFTSSIAYELANTLPYPILGISCTDMGNKHAACTDPWDVSGIRTGNTYQCMKGFYLNQLALIDASNAYTWYYANITDTKSMECATDGWQVQGTTLPSQRISAFGCFQADPSLSSTSCSAGNIQFQPFKLQFDLYRKQYTCYAGETLGYRFGTQITLGAGKKLYCGVDAANAPQWQWSLMDGTQATPIPIGATFDCF